MTTTTIRELQGDEVLDAFYWLPSYAFRSTPPMPDQAERHEILKQREGVTYLALFENDKPVACVASTPLTQQVRGTLLGISGVFDVVTHPAARRKGYSKRLLQELLACVRQARQPLSCLYPFRESFYERLGYVTFPQPKMAKLSPLPLVPLLKKDLAGEVELSLIVDEFDQYLDYLAKIRQRIHGMALFDHPDRALAQRSPYWLAQAKVDGEVAGLMLYNLKGERPTEYKMRVLRFYYHTAQGRYLLLAWIARHADQAKEVEIILPPFELPETWLADLNIVTEPFYVTPMGRILDFSVLNGMATGPGRFSVQIQDPLCSWNEGAWQFETIDGMLQVTKGSQADCELSVQGLSALIYGSHDCADFKIRGWGNPSGELQDKMRKMFPRMLPYLHEYF